jgi:hypothetical protein
MISSCLFVTGAPKGRIPKRIQHLDAVFVCRGPPPKYGVQICGFIFGSLFFGCRSGFGSRVIGSGPFGRSPGVNRWGPRENRGTVLTHREGRGFLPSTPFGPVCLRRASCLLGWNPGEWCPPFGRVQLFEGTSVRMLTPAAPHPGPSRRTLAQHALRQALGLALIPVR